MAVWGAGTAGMRRVGSCRFRGGGGDIERVREFSLRFLGSLGLGEDMFWVEVWGWSGDVDEVEDKARFVACVEA